MFLGRVRRRSCSRFMHLVTNDTEQDGSASGAARLRKRYLGWFRK
jgi:hypothetical protein